MKSIPFGSSVPPHALCRSSSAGARAAGPSGSGSPQGRGLGRAVGGLRVPRAGPGAARAAQQRLAAACKPAPLQGAWLSCRYLGVPPACGAGVCPRGAQAPISVPVPMISGGTRYAVPLPLPPGSWMAPGASGSAHVCRTTGPTAASSPMGSEKLLPEQPRPPPAHAAPPQDHAALAQPCLGLHPLQLCRLKIQS